MEDERAILQALAQRPFDAGVRGVYADFLLERGDPQGEAISLGAQPNPSLSTKRKLQKLTEAHGAAWLGPLAAVCDVGHVEWDGGFPSALTFRHAHDPQAWTAVVNEPRLATVRALTFPLTPLLPSAAAFLAAPVLRHVERLRAGLPLLQSVARVTPAFRLKQLAVASWGTGIEDLPDLVRTLDTVFLKGVRRLQLAPIDFFNQVVATELRQAIGRLPALLSMVDELEVHVEYGVNFESVMGWLRIADDPAIAERWQNGRRWALRRGELAYALVRDARGGFGRLEIDTDKDVHGLDRRIAEAAAVLRQLRAHGLREVEVKLPPGGRLRPNERNLLRFAARTLHSVSVLTIDGVALPP